MLLCGVKKLAALLTLDGFGLVVNLEMNPGGNVGLVQNWPPDQKKWTFSSGCQRNLRGATESFDWNIARNFSSELHRIFYFGVLPEILLQMYYKKAVSEVFFPEILHQKAD